jgi:threonine dehydrogenase-like Zn-dependent dehydrogenase
MKAVQYLGNHRVAVVDIPTPEPGPRDVLLEPLAVGVCGTDQHIIEGAYTSTPPITLGHEVCARVLEVGSEVASLVPGDLITVEPHIYCGVCVHCQGGRPHMCPRRQAPGVHLPGGMAERLVVPETLAFKLDPSTPPLIGAMTEPLACAVHGVDRLSVTSGSPAVVFGVGPAGALLISLLRRAGSTPLVAVEMREQRRDLALRMGADVVLDPTASDFTDKMLELTQGDGFAYLVDAVGSSRVLSRALTVAARGASLLVFGVASPDDRWEVSPNEVYAKELSILGTALNPFTHRRAAALVNHLGLDQLRLGTFALDQIEEALQAQRDGSFDKVLVLPNGTSW